MSRVGRSPPDRHHRPGARTHSGIQALFVIGDGDVLYACDSNDADHASMPTSFSIAKSVDSALIGIAIDEGSIAGVDDPVTDYLRELAERDR